MEARTMIDWKQAESKAAEYAERMHCDVLLYNGSIGRPFDHTFIKMCRGSACADQVVLILVTPGGDAHAAYRVARRLQESYQKFTVCVPGWCKSAGTLIAIGAHEILIGDCGELGPIDVQRGKTDELWESSSGLTEDAAFKALEQAALRMFGDYIFAIKSLSDGQVTFKTASDVAIKMVVGQLQPVYGQIDPLKIGETTRAMQIAEHYGLRLGAKSKNLKDKKSLDTLVTSYSSHAFVIDREEAAKLFNRVNAPDDMLEDLCEALGPYAIHPVTQNDNEPPTVKYLAKGKKDEDKQSGMAVPAASSDGPDANLGRAAGAAQADNPSNVAPIAGLGSTGKRRRRAEGSA